MKKENKANLIKKKTKKKKKKSKFKKILKKVFFIFSNKNKFTFSEIFAVTIISLLLGFFTCLSLFTIITGGKNIFKLSKDLGKFYDVYQVLLDNYNGNIDKDKLIDSAIDGMVSSVGDTYTNYNDTESTKNFNQMVSGTYEGIGCAITKVDEGIKIIEIYENSPTEKAGMKQNDIITQVDDLDAKDKSVNEIADYIKNKATGKIVIKAIRNDEELTFTLERNKVEIPLVVSKTLENNNKKIGYIGISIFASVTAKQFEKELKKLEKENIDALIIDVRGNNGGYLSSVTEIASKFLPKGKVIYQMEKNKKIEITKDKTSEKREYPIAIITNGGSASASEILAAVIKESYGGYVVGTKTYGKGTVQQVKQLSDGSMVKYTVENWLTPNGNWIDKVGIEPTDVVKLNEEYYNTPSDETDNQLQKAIELVSK